jgi:hypothetical protein
MIEFVPYQDPRVLDRADGVIVPQGIFEEIGETKRDYGGTDYTRVSHDSDLMVERERQVWNLIHAGGWVAFGVGLIRDMVPSYRTIHATDLCKRILNSLGVRREQLPLPISLVISRRDEFRPYVERFGVARTHFPEAGQGNTRALAVGGPGPVGFESDSKFFFLPFHTANRETATLQTAVELIARAVISYRLKMRADLPEWADKVIVFEKEYALRARSEALGQQLDELSQAIEEWRGYKKILVTSGDLLKDVLVTIFEKFFGFTVDPMDDGKEDFKILIGDRSLAVGEVKGVNGSVRREYVTQVDTHRERSDLPSTVPGLLVINTHRDVASLEGRAKHPVAGEQIRLAKTLNVLIVRAVDLLKLMQRLEGDADRRSKFIELLNSGGGLLVVDEDGYRVVVE